MQKNSVATLFLAGLAAVLVVGGATFGIVQALDLDEDDVTTGGLDLGGDDPAVADLGEDQVAVTGIATGITVQGATLDVIDTPLYVTTPATGGGAGATLHDVEVDGQPTDIVWDAGRPFDLQAAGLGIIPQEVNLFAAPTAITIGFPDGVVHQFVEGVYGLQTPVAIGRDGLARPQESVAFEATVESTVAFRGGATTAILPRQLTLEASGRVLIEGTLALRTRDSSDVAAAAIELPEGEYSVRFTPRADGSGYDVDAVLQGAVQIT